MIHKKATLMLLYTFVIRISEERHDNIGGFGDQFFRIYEKRIKLSHHTGFREKREYERFFHVLKVFVASPLQEKRIYIKNPRKEAMRRFEIVSQ